MTQAVLTVAGWLAPAIREVQYFFRSIKVKWHARKLASNTVKELSRLTDRELNDMGLHRGAIRGVAKHHYDEVVNKNLKGWV